MKTPPVTWRARSRSKRCGPSNTRIGCERPSLAPLVSCIRLFDGPTPLRHNVSRSLLIAAPIGSLQALIVLCIALSVCDL